MTGFKMMDRQALKSGFSIWLIIAQVWVVLIILVGAITRLTESGLSMVDWTLFMDMIPPLSHEQWMAVFLKYQQFPEFQLKNMTMTLSQFQSIYFWEYVHRLLGRVLGLLFLIPYGVFWLRRRIPPTFHRKLWGLFCLGGLQAAMGWYMVKSGLVLNPAVSHFRLAAHLVLALIILGGLFWTWLSYVTSARQHPNQGDVSQDWTMSRLGCWFWRICFVGVVFQVVYGAFMAGLDAGYISSTYPKLLGAYVPVQLFGLTWREFWLSNSVAIHFIHRTLGLVLTVGCWAGGMFFIRREPSLHIRRWLLVLMASIWVQFGLGVVTILSGMSIVLAVLHQLGAVVLILTFLAGFFLFSSRCCTRG